MRRTLERFSHRPARIGVRLVRDQEMARLNLRFLGLRGGTDVLTFDLSDDRTLEGEIYISSDRARRVAGRLGHDPLEELALYAVHGVLHLVGFDDAEADSADAMHRLEDDILEELGLGRPFGGKSAAGGRC